ncbi:MAG: response regulator transcription factor [Sulfurospirillaceae bacterium]|nr:response regulator transcription factor [Sulfurospirillaceae bacterium]MDD3463659.1 response regulator transcription factor [Sulfurospirillaceae bacterium]
MKILLLEDNERLSGVIKEALSQKGYTVDTFNDGKKALDSIDDGYDCFILDINVPHVDGLNILHAIRLMDKETPSVIISANSELETIQHAYKNGCDEYLKKPFYIYELETKVDRLCKPKKTHIQLPNGFCYCTQEERLTNETNNSEIKLAKKEILLLNLLSKNIDKTVTFEAIEKYVWAGELTTTENIRALVKRLRKKLPADVIENQGGIGYRFKYISNK